MSIWFEASTDLACEFRKVVIDLGELPTHFVGVTSAMPGVTAVELTEQGPDRIRLETNEGTMTRSGIKVTTAPHDATVEFDEHYQTSKLTVESHHRYTFGDRGEVVKLHLEISDVDAAGLLGFAYRNLGGKNIGTALLGAVKAHLDD